MTLKRILAIVCVLWPLLNQQDVLAQSSADALVDQCRRMALQEQGDSFAMFDSQASKEKELAESWGKKYQTMLAAVKKAQELDWQIRRSDGIRQHKSVAS